MPITVATLRPTVPAVAQLGDAAVPTVTFLSHDSAVIRGDILIFNAHRVDGAATTPDTNTIVGVATGAGTAQGVEVVVALALPSVLFEGSLSSSAAGGTDTAMATTHLGVLRTIVFQTPHYYIDFGGAATTATAAAQTIKFGRQINAAQSSQPFTAITSVLNPRVIFTFHGSIWARSAVPA